MPIYQKKTEYVLMNKESAVLSFLCSRNEFDEPEFRELLWHVFLTVLSVISPWLASWSAVRPPNIASISSLCWSVLAAMIWKYSSM